MIHKIFLTFAFIVFTSKGFSNESIEDLFSSSPEQIVTLMESEDFLIGGIIHPLSGQPCLHQTDLVARGAQSIALRRTFIPFYTPLNEHNGKIHPSKSSYGGWVYFPHSHLNVFKKGKNKKGRFIVSETIVSVADPQGTVLAYQIKYGGIKLKTKPWGICNGIVDHPSGIYDPRNTLISLEKRAVILHAPDGTIRYYQCSDGFNLSVDKTSYSCLYYLLEKEILPNGKVLRYHYKDRQIVKVESLDPKETTIYATLNLDAPLKETQAVCTTNTSLQATYTHQTAFYFKKDKRERYVDLLYPLRFTNVSSPFFRNEVIDYRINPYDDALLTGYSGRDLIFKCNCKYIPEKKKERKTWLVNELSLPSETGTFSSIYSMQYDLGIPGKEKSTTTVSHCDGIKTVYTFNAKMLPEKICEYDPCRNLVKEKSFGWNRNQWLQSITIKDGRQQLLSEKTFQYDSFGNPIVETLSGNLTGSGQIDHCEIKRTFSTNCRNLLLQEEHSNGKMICYSYLPETNLLTSCLIKEKGKGCLSREFRCYDNCNNLIQEIYDDGSSNTADDLTDVTERKMISYHLRQQQPFLHMPETIEVKCWENGGEKLLKRTHLLYDKWGNVSQENVYDAEGEFAYTITREYDEQGNVLSETNPLGQKAPYTYDAHGREKTSWNFANSLHTLNDYDARGRLLKTQETTIEGIARNYTFSHDDKNRLIKQTDNYNHVTTYTYDLIANKPKQTDQPTLFHSDGTHLAVTEKACYDPLGRKIESTDANGNVTRSTYNVYGSPTSIVYPDGSQESFRYAKNGQLTSHTCQNGLVICYQYDVLGNVTEKAFSFNGESLGKEICEYKGNKLLKSFDLEGNLTQYTYDGAGRKIREEKCGCLTTYHYDPLGEIAATCEENGENLLYTHFKRDLLGRVLEKQKTDGNGNLLRKVSYTYDGNGNIQTIERMINGHEAIETFAYDAYNRKISHQDAQGHLTTIHYDEKAFNPFGQQVLKRTITDPLQISIGETYDPYGRIVKHEKLNSALQTISANEMSYDACGNLLLHQDHVYEGIDYLTTKTVKWSYDAGHRIKEMTRAFGTPEERTTKWSYHPGGKIALKTLPDGIALSYTYDPLNNLKSIKSSDSMLHHAFSYNRLGHLLSATDVLNDLKIIREVDPHGNILLEEFPKGIRIKKTYDSLHRPTTMSLPDGSKVVYHYDPLFLRKVERLTPSGKTLYVHAYKDYDESGYLLTERLPVGLGGINHTRDTKGQPISISSDHFKQECQYDAIGNMTSQVINGANLTFDYDDLSQLISEPDYDYCYDSLYNRKQENGNKIQYNDLDELLSDQENTFIYDLRGNLSERTVSGQNQKFHHDPLDHLIEAEIDAKKISYRYDPLGRKLSKTVEQAGDVQKEYFLYDGRNEIGTISDKGEIQQLKVLGIGKHSEQRNSVAIELEGKSYVPLLDIQGNIRNLVDVEAKTIAASYNYTAFGRLFPLPNNIYNPWQYASKRFDSDLGLIDFGSRYYDPQLGRWLSTDPAGFIDSHNLYQFNFNNPFRYTDPNGECAIALFLPLLSGVFGVTAAGTTTVAIELVAAEVLIDFALATAFSEGLEFFQEAVEAKAIRHEQEAAEAKEEEKKKRNSPISPDPNAEGNPHTRIEKPGQAGQYTTHNGDGTYKQYRGSGKPHGPIERPNVKETPLNPLPDGTFRPGNPTVRRPYPEEIPK